MTLRQIVQTAPSKTHELIAKLANTSNEAVKTRERLFTELQEELTNYLELEQQQLLPVLRKHPDTKQLAGDAASDNRQLRARLAELAAAPKNEDVFLEKVTELKKGFQQHVRDERQELLPAVLKALTDEEAQTVTENMERAISEVEQAKREEKGKAADQAKREAEQSERAAAAERTSRRAAEAAERSARDANKAAAETVQRTADAAQVVAGEVLEASRQISDDAANMTRRGTETVQQTVQSGIEMATQIAERSIGQLAAAAGFPTRQTGEVAQQSSRNLQAIFDSGAVLAGAFQKVQQELLEMASDRQQQNLESFERMLRCRNVTELAAVQIEVARDQLESFVEGGRRASQVLGKAADAALRRMQTEQTPRSRSA